MKKKLSDYIVTNKTNNLLVILFTVLYFIVGIIGIYHHEMWRDEIQAWLVSAHNSTLKELFYNSRYEGHPILWFFILFILNKLHLPMVSMQIIHILIATGTIFLVFRFSPFSWLEKIGLALGNYLLYEYLIVSRAYGLGIFLLTLIVVLLNKPLRNLLFISITIALLANTSIWGLITAIGISFAILIHILPQLKSFFSEKNSLPIFSLSAVIILAGFILSVLKIKPPEDVSMMFEYVFGYDKERLIIAISSFTRSFFIRYSSIPLGLICLFIIIIGNRKNIFSLLFFLVPVVGILAFLYLTGKNDLRYLGVFPMLLIMSLWIFAREKKSKNIFTSLNKKHPLSSNVMFLLAIVVIVFQAFSGISRYKIDLTQKFSNIEDVGKFIESSRLNRYPIAGEIDYLATPFAAYSNNKPIFVIRRNEDCYYTIWDSKRTQNRKDSFTTLIDKINQYSNFEKMIVISHYPYIIKDKNNKQQVLTKGMINKELQISMIKKFDEKPIKKFEKFYIYEISKSKN